MHVPAVFRSTSPEVLEVHRGNVDRGRVATTKWRRFMDETGLEPVIVFHPQGAVVPGVYPAPGSDPDNPPPGWFWDTARGLLAPSLASNQDRRAGKAALDRLSDMEWATQNLPGLGSICSTHSITCLDFEDEIARLEALAVARRGDSAVLEIDGTVWLILPQSLVGAVDPVHWERSRRYLLEDALFTRTPALESLVA